jgi:hypothetical protein
MAGGKRTSPAARETCHDHQRDRGNDEQPLSAELHHGRASPGKGSEISPQACKARIAFRHEKSPMSL